MTTADYSHRDRAYFSVEKLIWQLVHKFTNRNGGDREDIFQDCVQKWFESYPKFDPNLGYRLTTWTTAVLGNYLEDIRKGRQRAFRLMVATSSTITDLAPDRAQASILDELVGDAQYMAALLVEPPQEVLDSRSSTKAKATWAAIKKYLKRQGWSRERIEMAILEGGACD